MTPVDWDTLTVDKARRLIGPASCAEQKAAAIWDRDGTPEAERAWREAFDLWENLRVYAICGVKP